MSEESLADQVADGIIEYVTKTLGKSKGRLLRFPGGDWPIREPLLELISKAPCTCFVEVFGGGGLMTMLVPRSKFKVIVYNDKNDLLVNFFKVLKERPKELQRRLALTPCARKIYEEYRTLLVSGKIRELDPVERAVAVFYFHNYGFSGSNRKGFSTSTKSINNAAKNMRRVAALVDFASRWVDVTIENLDFRDVIRKYDREHTLFYCDPPYLSVEELSTRDYYDLEFSWWDMRTLLSMLSEIKGKFVLKLPKDHLRYEPVYNWIKEHGYRVREVEHTLWMDLAIGERRRKTVTVLVYNYGAGTLRGWLG